MNLFKKKDITSILLSYNNSSFIGEAVRSLLEQKFPPMEIIISDDCSTDSTYRAIRKICDVYNGPHRLIVRRNERNLGVVRHLNHLVGMAHGSLIVLAAGDDISSSNKTKRLFEVWKNTGACLIGCNPDLIDNKGNSIGRFSQKSRWTTGWKEIIRAGNAKIFVSAFSKQFFEQWGGLPEWLPMEDQTLVLRAALTKPKGVHVVDEPLVKYRRHEGSAVSRLVFTDASSGMDVMLSKLRSRRLVHISWLQDLMRAQGNHLNMYEKKSVIRKIEHRIACYQMIERAIGDKREFWRGWNDSDAGSMCKMIAMLSRYYPKAFYRGMALISRLRKAG